MKRLLILTTGGTIAGRGNDSAQLDHYTAGVIAGDELLKAVPQVQELAILQLEQIANVDSADLRLTHWRSLVERIREVFAEDSEVAGVVITHGTNTLEETAWLLQLLIDDPRPIVLVGAMRPATALSADGPLNLLQAVQVALSSAARGQGVLIVMDGQIHCAEAVTKSATQGVGAFTSPGIGPLGWVDDAGVHLLYLVNRRPKPLAQLQLRDEWPQVAIVYGCVEPPAALISALLMAEVQGMVFTGTGSGQLSELEHSSLHSWKGPLPLMLYSNRCGSGLVHNNEYQSRLGLLPAGRLNPQKARVLLMLALIAGFDRSGLAFLLQYSASVVSDFDLI
ncbi:asparaginase [Synechococcus sp. M16CYN]|uniref:asparaginase n=1 Tax=Synechococcus sp. M16CYN TaxID=3103139 RepID=UPI003255A86D